MPAPSNPTRVPGTGSDEARITICFEGQTIEVRANDSVAAALIASGITTTRASAVSHSPRGPYCMMGVCFECLVNINGMPNQQACMVTVSEGMQIKRMGPLQSVAHAKQDWQISQAGQPDSDS